MIPNLKLKNNLKSFRRKFCLSQSELARIVGCSTNTISSLETGQSIPTAYLAARLCSAFGCTFNQLFVFYLVD